MDVSWKDTGKFVKWMNRWAGKAFSLPTESQWEYAAGAGTRTARFWGDDSADACRHANVFDITIKDRFHYPWDNHACDDGHILTAPVGRFLPNAFGLHDMLGNVSEWCEDVINPDDRVFPLTYAAARLIVKKAGNLVDIHVRPHDLRRHAATYASRSGTPLEIVSKILLRHSKLSTTQRYLEKISDAEAMRWIDNLHG